MDFPYTVLVPWCKLPEHANQTDAERLAALHAKTLTRIVDRFGSFRTLAAVLTPDEYATMRQTLSAVAAQSPLVADMVKMLELPGDESGTGGGINFGNASVRAMCDQLFPGVATTLQAIAEEQVSQCEAWGVELSSGHLASARQLIEEGN